MKLTAKQKKVLEAVAMLNGDGKDPDHHMIAVRCGKEYSAADWAHEPLRRLAKSRLVVSIGKSSPYGGRRWKITKTGHKAISNATT